jgi:hypothetical protein
MSGGAYPQYQPTSFQLKASNTGAFSGEEITFVTETSFSWTYTTWEEWIFDNSTSYRYWRIYCNAGDASYCMFHDIELHECQD